MRQSILLIVLLCPNAPAYALDGDDDFIHVGRYSLLRAGTPPDQHDVLSAMDRVEFAATVTTVGEAMRHVLNDSGYALAPLAASDPKLPVLLRAPLPRPHRSMGPARLEDILETLAGPAWRLVTDHLHRLVSFERQPAYQ